MYAITGATGNIGRRVAEGLLAKGKKVRVIGRDLKRLEPLAAKGAETFVGSVDDVAAMINAFQGTEAVFAMLPPNMAAENVRVYQNKVGEALAAAIKDAGVRYVVNLSSLGAHLIGKVGVVNGLGDQEQCLNKLEGVNIVHLRPAFFMENLLWNVDMIKNMGIMGSTIRGNITVPMIATQDIADVATKLLMDLDFKGKSIKELFGQRNLSHQEAAKILGKAIGKENLPFMQFPYDDAEKAMIGMGMTADMAKAMTDLQRAVNDGIFGSTEKRTAQNTTPTSIEDFAMKVFAPTYNA